MSTRLHGHLRAGPTAAPRVRRQSRRWHVRTKCAKLDLLAIDDWLLAPLTDAERRDLLEVIEDRNERASTLIASQLPPTAWHEAIGEPSVADAICQYAGSCRRDHLLPA